MPDTGGAVIQSEARDPSPCLKGPALRVRSAGRCRNDRVREAGVGERVLAMGGREKGWMEKTLYTGERTSEFLKDRLQLPELTEKTH